MPMLKLVSPDKIIMHLRSENLIRARRKSFNLGGVRVYLWRLKWLQKDDFLMTVDKFHLRTPVSGVVYR
jgi:hypothetical protein